jgi:hypothetical protein
MDTRGETGDTEDNTKVKTGTKVKVSSKTKVKVSSNTKVKAKLGNTITNRHITIRQTINSKAIVHGRVFNNKTQTTTTDNINLKGIRH